jgi:uncharacterized protein DUF222/HNH endonuclease
VDTQLRRLAAVDARLIGELDQRHLGADLGARNTAGLLHQLLRVAPGEAAARVRAARELGPRRGLSGEALAPIFPVVADALAAGQLNPAHARVIVKTMDAIPAEAEHAALGRGEQLAEQVETTLVAHAARLDPRQLGHVATRLLGYLDPDGAAPRDEELQRRRRLDVHTRADGTGLLRGELSPETAAIWTTVLDALSRPAPESETVPDPRTAAQRRHDALLDAGQRLLRAGELPDAGGTPVTLLITLTPDQLATPTGYGLTEHGELLAAGTALRMADAAAITSCVLDTHGGMLDYGTTRRLATAGMRRALAARDSGCTFPGCTIPPSWCQTHHVIPWRAGGPTSLNNLTLLCGHHHRSFEQAAGPAEYTTAYRTGPHRRGWTTTKPPASTPPTTTTYSTPPNYSPPPAPHRPNRRTPQRRSGAAARLEPHPAATPMPPPQLRPSLPNATQPRRHRTRQTSRTLGATRLAQLPPTYVNPRADRRARRRSPVAAPAAATGCSWW